MREYREVSRPGGGWGPPSVVGPLGLAEPAETEARVGADLDGGSLGGPHCVLHRPHQVLRIQHQLLHRFLVLLAPCNIPHSVFSFLSPHSLGERGEANGGHSLQSLLWLTVTVGLI